MCDVVSVSCDGLFHRNKIMKLTAWLTSVIYSANIGCETIFTVCGVCLVAEALYPTPPTTKI